MDRPLRIIDHSLINDEKNDTFPLKNSYFEVEWQRRADGIKPMPSIYSYISLKKTFPKLLIQYLEQVIT